MEVKKVKRVKNPKVEKPKKVTYQCEFCEKKFRIEDTYKAHDCPGKRLAYIRTRNGFNAISYWLEFLKINGIATKKDIPLDQQFIKSQVFCCFKRLSEYIEKNQIFDSEGFVKYLFLNDIKERQWENYQIRRNWICSALKLEDFNSAISRSIISVQQWALDTNNDWRTFFSAASIDRIILWIETGKISPWFLYACSTFEFFLDRISSEEFDSILPFIDPNVWFPKRERIKSEFTIVQNLLAEFKI